MGGCRGEWGCLGLEDAATIGGGQGRGEEGSGHNEQLPAPPGSGRSGGQRWLAGGDRGLGDSEGTGDYWEGRARVCIEGVWTCYYVRTPSRWLRAAHPVGGGGGGGERVAL